MLSPNDMSRRRKYRHVAAHNVSPLKNLLQRTQVGAEPRRRRGIHRRIVRENRNIQNFKKLGHPPSNHAEREDAYRASKSPGHEWIVVRVIGPLGAVEVGTRKGSLESENN